MGQDRVSAALSRIERAVARLEAAGAHGAAGSGEELDGLRHAHSALREKVAGAVARIDRLLETEGTG